MIREVGDRVIPVHPADRRPDWVSIGVFLAITFGFGWGAFVGLRGLGVGFSLRADIGTFAPAIAAVLATWIRRQDGSDLGLRFRPDRTYLYGFILPPVLLLAGIALSLATGYQHWALRGAASLATWQPLLALSIGSAFYIVFAVGEELGWRGYLLPKLGPLGAPFAAIAVGGIWGLWHAPVIGLDGYEFGVKSWLVAPFFCLFTVPVSVVMAWLRWRSSSIWPVVIMHAGINVLARLWPWLLSSPDSTLIGSPVGVFGIIPIAIFATWLIASGRLRPTGPDVGAGVRAPVAP